MKVLINEKLSEHKFKTPEGYLICTDAILARTGKQTYTKDELFCNGDSTEVDVDRPYNEVMNNKTIASFENKPITFDHPNEDVNIVNYKDYAIGYVRDVHQGKTENGEDVIMGNLVITDKDAIEAIENGDHTDLSCGYDCDIVDSDNGYAQHNIRGNHVALCECGRAGNARIVDSRLKDEDEYNIYKIEYMLHRQDYKTQEDWTEKHTATIKAKSVEDAVDVLPNDVMIIRIYKNNKLLKSFTSHSAGMCHGSATINKVKQLKLDNNKENIMKDNSNLANEITKILNELGDDDVNTINVDEIFKRLKRKYSFAEYEDVESALYELGYAADRYSKYIRQYFKDSNIIKDDWHGTRNGINYWYHNGDYFITHKNGKVERLPESKFQFVEDLYRYIDTIKDSTRDSSTSEKLWDFILKNGIKYEVYVYENEYYFPNRTEYQRVKNYAKQIGYTGEFIDNKLRMKHVEDCTKDAFEHTMKIKKSEIDVDYFKKALKSSDYNDIKFVKEDSQYIYVYGDPNNVNYLEFESIKDSKLTIDKAISLIKLTKYCKDAKVVNEDELEFINKADKIYKRNNKDKQFVVKTISDTDAVGYASADGGQTWQTAKTRIVKRHNSSDTRHQEERRFSATDRSVEIPFSHIVYCYYNHCNTIPNETIDHKDGNHLNDKIENLEPVSNDTNIKRMRQRVNKLK